jgi:hypothetical protein
MSEFGSRWRNAVHAMKEQFQMPGPNMALDREPVEIRCDRSLPPATWCPARALKKDSHRHGISRPLRLARFSSYLPRATAETTSRFTSTRIA